MSHNCQHHRGPLSIAAWERARRHIHTLIRTLDVLGAQPQPAPAGRPTSHRPYVSRVRSRPREKKSGIGVHTHTATHAVTQAHIPRLDLNAIIDTIAPPMWDCGAQTTACSHDLLSMTSRAQSAHRSTCVPTAPTPPRRILLRSEYSMPPPDRVLET